MAKMDKLKEEYENYNPDEDTTGAMGMKIADRIYQKYGRFNIKNQEKKNLWKKIAFRKFPPLLSGETILSRELKERFRELKEAGYEIKKSYSNFNKNESWEYLKKIRKDISSLFED